MQTFGQLGNSEDIPEALAEFRKAADIKPNDTLALEWMIKIYNRLEDYKNVAECYREILRREPDNLGSQWGLVKVLVWHLEEYEDGLKLAIDLREKDKTSTSKVAEQTIGRAYEGLKDYPNAITHYKIWLKYSNRPTSYEYKDIAKKVSELEKLLKETNSKID